MLMKSKYNILINLWTSSEIAGFIIQKKKMYSFKNKTNIVFIVLTKTKKNYIDLVIAGIGVPLND